MRLASARWFTSARLRGLLDALATLAFIAVSVTLIWSILAADRRPGIQTPSAQRVKRADPPPPVEPVSIEGAVTHGSKGAKLALIEYSDFQCPFCAKFANDVLPGIEDKYIRAGTLLLVFRHLPLGIHPFAQKAAEAAECAGAQGRFWDMHTQLFQDPKRLAESDLHGRAVALGLDVSRFASCLSGTTTEKVRADAVQAKALRITGTPTFFVGLVQSDGRVKVSQRLSGAQPLVAFEQAFEKAAGAAPRVRTSSLRVP